ncbi:hypothetical protein K502DRAFT_324306 [Neoconidiobolus thromboides FSU 785]|nr:hypothetical protein K502DRAFT_324306 [Neoconidiobolus thromboides FSU 785]
MFLLSRLKDTIQIEPVNLNIDFSLALINEINKKYCNRVIHNVGLCITLFDVIEQQDAYLYHSDGCSYVKVEFRMIVFRPFIGEVITGKVKSMSDKGIKISLGFFDDIEILPNLLHEGTKFHTDTQVYIWCNEHGNYEWEKGEEVKVKVEKEIFFDAKSTPNQQESLDEFVKSSPYQLVCSAFESGYGLTSWW